MPLLDPFHPPLSETRKWEGFHSHWTSSLAAQLNAGLLPPRHFAEPQVTPGRIEVDVTTDRLGGDGAASGQASASGGGVATRAAPVWSPPAPSLEIDAVFAAEFTVLVTNVEAGPVLVGAIELVSPSNKARPAARRAFAIKCLNYLNAGIGLIVVDVVTERRANLHDEMAGLIVGAAPRFPGTPLAYAAAYRPFRRGAEDKVSVWPVPLAVGGPLPLLPLWLREVEEPVRVDLEAAYTEVRQRPGPARKGLQVRLQRLGRRDQGHPERGLRPHLLPASYNRAVWYVSPTVVRDMLPLKDGANRAIFLSIDQGVTRPRSGSSSTCR
jgi:hypothetical protein